jgi:hypothetical protein
MKTGEMEKARSVMQRRGGKKGNLAIFPVGKVGGPGGKGQGVPAAAPPRRDTAPDVNLGKRLMKAAYATPIPPSRMKRIERLRAQIHEGSYCIPSLILAERLIEQNAC